MYETKQISATCANCIYYKQQYSTCALYDITVGKTQACSKWECVVINWGTTK